MRPDRLSDSFATAVTRPAASSFLFREGGAGGCVEQRWVAGLWRALSRCIQNAIGVAHQDPDLLEYFFHAFAEGSGQIPLLLHSGDELDWIDNLGTVELVDTLHVRLFAQGF